MDPNSVYEPYIRTTRALSSVKLMPSGSLDGTALELLHSVLSSLPHITTKSLDGFYRRSSVSKGWQRTFLGEFGVGVLVEKRLLLHQYH